MARRQKALNLKEMKTELLIIKNKKDYIRIIDGTYHLCNLDKASVFPLDQLNIVNEHVEKAMTTGFKDACIKKLIITEEDL